MALKGIRVVEMAGLAPAPYCGMILADFGAKVIRVDRPNAQDLDCSARGKQSVIVNLKKEKGADVVKRLCRKADVVLEPYRPGIMEKMGLGPESLMKDNPGLVYARLTGFGQSGPLANSAGHDINYIAISGILSAMGRKEERPYPPVNLLGDFAGGGMVCALGIVMALLERHSSGRGQIVDANMVQGSAYVGSWLWRARSLPGVWGRSRGKNALDGGAAFYDVYETRDGKFISVGALEPHFFQAFIQGLNLDASEVSQMSDQAALRQKFGEVFKTKTRDEWAETFKGMDACIQPVLGMDEAASHPQNKAIGTFLRDPVTGKPEPAPAPRLSRTPGIDRVLPQPAFGQDTVSALLEAGMDRGEVDRLLKEGVVVDGGDRHKAML